GVLDKLAASVGLSADIAWTADLKITLAFGVDQDGFFVSDESGLELHVAGSGSVSGNARVGGVGVAVGGSGSADLTVAVQLGQPGRRLRPADLQANPATYLVATADGSASLALDRLQVGPVGLSWHAGFTVTAGADHAVAVATEKVSLGATLTVPGLDVVNGATHTPAVVPLAGTRGPQAQNRAPAAAAGPGKQYHLPVFRPVR